MFQLLVLPHESILYLVYRFATSDMVDRKTRIQLLKLINSGDLDAIHGVISTGKARSHHELSSQSPLILLGY